MKTLMQKVGGYKKPRLWNMAQFQTRRWHREQDGLQAAKAEALNQESAQANSTSSGPPLCDPQQPTSIPETLVDLQKPRKSQKVDTTCVDNAPDTIEHSTVPSPSLPSLPSVKNHQVSPDPLPPVESRLRTGKIARLPENIRNEVNHLLRHAVPYADVSKRLADLGYPGVSINNIYNWRHGGFVDWYRDMQAREAPLIPLKALERCSRAIDIDRWQQNALLMAAEKFSFIMAGINHQRAAEALNQRPELLPKYVAAMRDLTRCSTDLAKAFDVARRHESTIRHDLNLQNLSLPPEPEPDDEEDPSPISQPPSPVGELETTPPASTPQSPSNPPTPVQTAATPNAAICEATQRIPKGSETANRANGERAPADCERTGKQGSAVAFPAFPANSSHFQPSFSSQAEIQPPGATNGCPP